MKENIVSRLIATCIIGLMVAFWIRHNIHNKVQEGRDAYLAAQAASFDQQVKVESKGRYKAVVAVIVGIGAGVVIFGFYELIVAGVGVVMKRYVRVQRDLTPPAP